MQVIETVASADNLRWAWEKALSIYRMGGDGWVDELEVSRFEANLDRELRSIERSIRNVDYAMSPIRPLPQPKKATSANEKPVRQTFWIAVRDQVTWIAFVNVIGESLDRQMQPWSYAYRLYRPVWYDDEMQREFRRGPYRNTAGRLYRPFRQSWPLYRRHIALTVRAAARLTDPPADEAEAQVLKVEQQLEDKDRLPYLVPGWWTKRPKTLHRAHVDLRKFYPNIRLNVILQNLTEFGEDIGGEITTFAEQLLKFPLDLGGISGDELCDLGILSDPDGGIPAYFTGLPTGLLVAGFLSNVAFLGVDKKVAARTRDMQIAHFRYVDDHTFLATSLKSLLRWIEDYHALLVNEDVGVDFHRDKIDPPAIREVVADSLLADSPKPLKLNQTTRRELERETSVDPRFPTPLLTATLAKISGVVRTPFALLDRHGEENLVEELEFLLAAQLPDDEIRDDTRVSFAMGRLAMLAPQQTGWIDEKVRRIQAERILKMFLRATQGHPEKMRLWLRTLQFCRRSGIHRKKQLNTVWHALLQYAKGYEPSGAYLRAYVKTFLASEVLRCVWVVRDRQRFEEDRLDAARFLKAIMDSPLHSDTKSQRWFEAKSSELLNVAVMAARFMVRDAGIGLPKSSSSRNRLISQISYPKDAEHWKSTMHQLFDKDDSFATSCYWLEKKLTSGLAAEPSPVWRCLAPALRETSEASRALWARYPAHLPDQAIPWATRSSSEWPHSDLGWLWDAWTGMASRGLTPKQLPDDSEMVAKIQKASKPLQNQISLLEWTTWCAEAYLEFPHDPRVGEWTALAICIGIAHELEELGDWDGTYLHPANIMLDKKWIAPRNTPWTWEGWHGVVKGSKVCPRLRRQNIIHDHRFITQFPKGDDKRRQWSLIQGLGVLLLGLVRRSFEPPAIWNQPGYALASAFPARSLINQMQLSSWTTALLEACLLPRVRETMLFFDSLFVDADDDTTADPPLVWDLEDFLKYASHAQSILEGFQLMVHGSMPRQLIPRHLDQLKQEDWHDDPESNLEDA